MNTIKLKSHGKINLVLEIENRREDGYHNLNTVMQSLTLHDNVKVSLLCGSGINIKCNLPYVPRDDKNLTHKATVKFYNAIEKEIPLVEIELDKRIPVGAGLAGGSSNAGAVLLALNKMEGNPLPINRLLKIGSELGADVPFTMMGGCAKAYGLGHELTRCSSMPPCHIVLCKPRFSVSTKWAYESLTADDFSSEDKSGQMSLMLDTKDIFAVAKNLSNTFERPIGQEKKEIFKLKSRFMEYGAIGSLMSGSGSAVYGIFTSHSRAQNAWRMLKRNYCDVYVAQPYNGNNM